MYENRDMQMAEKIARAVKNHGGRCYYTGGYVRDKLLIGMGQKDIDIEVHGIHPGYLKLILDASGSCMSVGESFGIYTLKGYGLDISMPRKADSQGLGFPLDADPFIGTEEACRRRDFTINSMLQDVLSGEIIDHFGGMSDLQRFLLRHVDDNTFPQDPLRVLRCAQFAARLGFDIADETMELCSKIDISGLSRERVAAELEKALTRSSRPSVFFESLRKMGQLSVWFPELEALIGIEQPPQYHAEGDAWTHTMMVLDKAAAKSIRLERPYRFMLSALCHDFGKALCTVNENGKIHSHEHEILGLPAVRSFLTRLTDEKMLIRYVMNMTELHMRPLMMAAQNSSVKATNKMYDRSVDPQGLMLLALCDDEGRISAQPRQDYMDFLQHRLEIYREHMARPYVSGKDLIDAGIEPGEQFGKILEYAHKLRLAGVDKESALKQSIAYSAKLQKDQAT